MLRPMRSTAAPIVVLFAFLALAVSSGMAGIPVEYFDNLIVAQGDSSKPPKETPRPPRPTPKPPKPIPPPAKPTPQLPKLTPLPRQPRPQPHNPTPQPQNPTPQASKPTPEPTGACRINADGVTTCTEGMTRASCYRAAAGGVADWQEGKNC